MKKILTILAISSVALMSTTATIAQDAKTILQKVSTKYKASTGMKANFTLTMFDTKGANKGSQKGVILLKGNKYKVIASNQEMITDGKTLWTFRKADKEVMVDNVGANAISPAKLFAGSYEKEYNYKGTGTKTVSGKVANVIELTPKTAQQSFKKVDLYVDKTTNAILGGKIFEKNGSSMEYTLSNINDKAALTDAQFTFNAKAYPGVEVIDLR